MAGEAGMVFDAPAISPEFTSAEYRKMRAVVIKLKDVATAAETTLKAGDCSNIYANGQAVYQ